MKITRNKVVTLVTVILLSLMITSIFAVFNATAVLSGPGFCYNYILLNPDGVIGVNQKVSYTIWTGKPNAGTDNNLAITAYFSNWTVVIHRPDGKIDYSGHIPGTPTDTIFDTTATFYGFYIPTVVGNYTFEFFFPNQTTSGGGQAGFYYTNYNATAYLTVQKDPVIGARDSYPLPQEYWYRPIESQSSWWAGFPGSPTSNWYNSVRDKNYNDNFNVRYQPDGVAPASAHVMWTSNIASLPETSTDAANYYNPPIFSTQIIMNGMLYYQPLELNNDWRQVDLRTGQLLNESQTYQYSFGYAYAMDSQNTHGVLQNGFIFTPNYARAVEAGNLQPGHGWTWTMNPLPRGSEAVGPQGEHFRVNLTYTTTGTPRWVVRDFNTSKVFSSSSTSLTVTSYTNQALNDWIYTVVQRDSTGNLVNAALASDSVEVGNFIINDNYGPGLSQATLLCRNGTMPTAGNSTNVTFFAIALMNQTIGGNAYTAGQIMWMKNINAPSDGSSLLKGPNVEDVFTLVSPETGTWSGYSMYTGDKLWQSDPQTNFTPYGYTAQTTATGATVSAGNGKLVTAGMGGNVFCYDLHTGTMLWHKSYPVSYAANVVNYPTNIGLMCDGKVYLGTYNPSANQSLLSGSMIRCLNVTSGDEIWSMPGFGSAGGYAVSDGYLVLANYYDMTVYCIGKGPSATTVNPVPDVAYNGAKVTITGTCLDMSPGSPIKGTAAISDASMGSWVAYKFQGAAKPTDVKGVDVVISAFDPNGNWETVGTAIVNDDGTFSYEWTPPVPGTYQVTASFLGSNSYYPSLAHSTLYVSGDNAPGATNTPSTGPVNDNTVTYITYSAGAIIATFIIIAAAIFLMIKKKA